MGSSNHHLRLSFYGLLVCYGLAGALVLATVGCGFRYQSTRLSPTTNQRTVSLTVLTKSTMARMEQGISLYDSHFYLGPVSSSGDSQSIKAAGSAVGEAAKAGVVP